MEALRLGKRGRSRRSGKNNRRLVEAVLPIARIGNRNAFAGGDSIALHPDFAPSYTRATWETQGCAPISTDPTTPTLRRIHTALLAATAATRMARVSA